jgi:hypothetical protein
MRFSLPFTLEGRGLWCLGAVVHPAIGHLQVFLLIVFLSRFLFSLLYCNTCAVLHGYMYVIFDILFYMLSVYGNPQGRNSGPVCGTGSTTRISLEDSGSMCYGMPENNSDRLYRDSAGPTRSITPESAIIPGGAANRSRFLLVPDRCAQEVCGDPQRFHLIR